MRVASYGELTTFSMLDDRERFNRADRLARSVFTGLAADGLIRGAFPFGSVQFNDHNPFSDYDILVMTDENGVSAETISFRAIHDAAKSIHNQTALPLEVTCYTAEQLYARLHNIPDSMLAWFKEQRKSYPQNVIGEDFIDAIPTRVTRESPRILVELDDYVARTRHVLKKNWWQGCYFRPCDLLGVVLSVPHILGRKTLDTLQYSGLLARDTLPDFKKDTIANSVLRTFGEESRIGELYREITDDSYRYQDELVVGIEQLSAEEYDQVIESVLEYNLPKAIELLRRIQEAYRNTYNDSARSIFEPSAEISPYVEKGSNLPWEVKQHAAHSRMVSEIRASQMESD